ncbi:site-specific recombinase, phage integrase family [Acidisarcina polymorpha]|uniref:Site-specific recombinase, phage integrase family n=1 Tax=Acidisarcina polymorpha TaxID=2211140 RepID=A0A2Z5G3P2_9BACT|nr:site-specific integrase [Acidisarcina polymorpha]AXC13751.1 site-specific recombinase, phage integrase family [Acidisarcina polymorpha]
MKFTRQRFQRGYLRRVPRANNKTAWEYRYKDPTTGKEKSMYLSTEQFPTQVAVERHVEAFVLKLNAENPTLAVLEPTFSAVLDRFIDEERMLEIKKRRPGDRSDADGELSYSTVISYLSVIKRVRAKWGTTRITRMKPLSIQEWLRNLDAAPKTKGHLKAIMHRLYEKAMLWEMVDWQRNPMELVEVKGISKRRKKPVVLTVDQYYLILSLLPEPYRTMVVVAQCTGLRAEEVLALEWDDIDFENLSMRIVRAVVHGRIKAVKTEYSEDELPLDPDFATALLEWKRKSADPTRFTGLELMFPSHVTGRHYHTAPAQQDYIRPAGCCLVACPTCGAGMGVWCRQEGAVPNGGRLPLHDERWEAAGKYGSVGWHTFRHTYRSWLDDTGAPMGVQQKLMRHAQISTTMNVYGNALMEAKREANTRVVRKALRSA